MRLGQDALVLTKHTTSQSVGFLSQTFLKASLVNTHPHTHVSIDDSHSAGYITTASVLSFSQQLQLIASTLLSSASHSHDVQDIPEFPDNAGCPC